MAVGCGGESTTTHDGDGSGAEAGDTSADAGENGSGRGGSTAGRGGKGGGGSAGTSAGSGQAGTRAGDAGRSSRGGEAGEAGTSVSGKGGSEAGAGGEAPNPECDEDCDDDNECTMDSCIPGVGCRYVPLPEGPASECRRCDGFGNEELLDDDDRCGEIDCSERYTRGGDDTVLGTKGCFSHEPLTIGRCTPAGACRAPNGTACNDAPTSDEPEVSCGACQVLRGCDGTTPGRCENADDTVETGNTCGTGACQRNETCDGSGASVCTPGSPGFETCADGIDQDCDGADIACPTNDAPGSAIDISAGGTFIGDLSNSQDDQNESGLSSCGNTGGRDVFFQFTLPSAEVIYFDTYASNFDTVVRIYNGACNSGGSLVKCWDDACISGAGANGAQLLDPGTYCLVLDQYSSATVNGSYSLKFLRTARTGTEIAATSGSVTGTTIGGLNQSGPTCRSSDAPDVGYYFTSCPNTGYTVSANTCTGTDYDSVIYMRDGAMSDFEPACNDDYCGTLSSFSGAHVSGPNIHWLIVDGYLTNIGNYTLTYSITSP